MTDEQMDEQRSALESRYPRHESDGEPEYAVMRRRGLIPEDAGDAKATDRDGPTARTWAHDGERTAASAHVYPCNLPLDHEGFCGLNETGR